MADIKKLSDELSVSGQVFENDIETLSEQGVKSVICNRPDYEDMGQPGNESIAELAKAKGMAFEFMPVQSGNIAMEDGEQFAQVIDKLPKPIHAYCRSGTRCTILWGIAEFQKGSDADHIIQTAAKAGYDLSKLF